MTRWASIVVARKWWVLAVVLIAAVVAGIWGTGVFSKLSQGGYTDPGSESAQVSKIVDDNFGRQDPDIVAIYTVPAGQTLAELEPVVTETLDRFAADVPTQSVTSYWTAVPPWDRRRSTTQIRMRARPRSTGGSPRSAGLPVSSTFRSSTPSSPTRSGCSRCGTGTEPTRTAADTGRSRRWCAPCGRSGRPWSDPRAGNLPRRDCATYAPGVLSTFDPRTPRERGAGSVTDWDEIKQWSDAVYMPYSVRPVGRGLVPASDMFSVKIAEMTLTRFSYGIPVALSEFEPEAGNVLVLTTLNGRTRHEVTTKSSVDLRSGQTFVVDCSRVDSPRPSRWTASRRPSCSRRRTT